MIVLSNQITRFKILHHYDWQSLVRTKMEIKLQGKLRPHHNTSIPIPSDLEPKVIFSFQNLHFFIFYYFIHLYFTLF